MGSRNIRHRKFDTKTGIEKLQRESNEKKKTKTNKTQKAVRTNKNTNFTKNTGLGTRQK